jgi:murein DD-endopeptidase MepM/ murein hydrolase activator NlpD
MEGIKEVATQKVKAIVKRQIKLLLIFVFKLLLPYVVIVSAVLMLILGLCAILGVLKNEEINAQATRNLTNLSINSNLTPQDKTVKVNNIDYPLPRIKGLSEKDFYALMTLRVSEFSNRQDYDLAGMEDSCSLYQQRLSELVPNGNLSEISKELLGEDKYKIIFTFEMSKWIIDNSWTVRTNQIPKTSDFGERDPIYIDGVGTTPKFHDALDFGYRMRTPVVASNGGIVEKVVNPESGLKYVVLKHENPNYFTSYLHLDSVSVNEKDVVVQGQQIGLSGNTGLSTAPHLHYSVYKDWQGNFNKELALNPLNHYQDTLLFIQQPFFGSCRMLQYEQIQNGFFDKLQLRRFEIRQPKYKDFNLTITNTDEFIEMLVRSHAPREDTIQSWKDKASKWLISARINNAYQTYLDSYN